MGEPDAACKAYEAALEIAQDLRPSMKIEDACAGLARVEQARDNRIGARRWATRAASEADEFDQVRGYARRQLEACFTLK